MTACVPVKCSLTLSTYLRNELAFQQNACKTGQEVSSAKRLTLAVLVQDASMRGAQTQTQTQTQIHIFQQDCREVT